MIRHNFKVSYRQMLRNKAYSFINIGGLAMGMVVAMLIGLWVHDELTFNQYHKSYDNIVQVLGKKKYGNSRSIQKYLTTAVGVSIAENFPDFVDKVFMVVGQSQSRVIANSEKKSREVGVFMQENGPGVLGFEMISGTQEGLKEIRSIMLSESFAKRLFGDEDPMNKSVIMDGKPSLIVTGVYKDIPDNSKFADAAYVARTEIVIAQKNMNIWSNQNVHVYAKVTPGVNLDEFGSLITKMVAPHYNNHEREMELFLHPMKDWHLSSEFRDFVPVMSQQMKFVWLYSIIGVFVLILACINFTNLSTARSEKRAKETGIRKTLGSIRKELIAQFYMESLLYSLLAFCLSLILLAALLPWFNETSGKTMESPWATTGFWLISMSFIFLTAILAGSYPALYLSSFKPVKALKGTFSAGKRVSLPRRILVVFQFTISIALIIGTITVNNQIQTAKNRPVGYSPKGLISLKRTSPDFSRKSEVLKTEMMSTGMAQAIGTSNYPIINVRGWNGGFTWDGMDESFDESFNTIGVSHGYTEAVGMELIAGRDFSLEFETDRNAIIINRSAMKLMNLDNPIGTIVSYAPGWKDSENYTVIGVVEDMIKDSPFGKTEQSVIFLINTRVNYMYIRLNPNLSASESIAGLKRAFEKVLPNDPFDFSFADDDYNNKFVAEERIGRQATFFSVLAILISSLGLFGLASYMAEQRTKEIGIRKVLGASIGSIWTLLSKDFVHLLVIACFISIPIAYSVLNNWLDTYEVRTQLYWWIFAVAGFGALLIALITVSFQALKAAISNPVKSLRSE